MSLISELQRRNVIRVATAYVALAWLVVQVLDTLAPIFGISEAAARLVVIALAIGCIPVLTISWLFELTPKGFRREGEVDHAATDSRASTRRLDRVIIGVLALAVIYFAVDKFVFDPSRDAELASEAAEQARVEALTGSFGERSIAVLPFADTSADKDQEYLSDGIAEEIINLLSTVRDIRVISRSSSFAFRDRAMPLAEIAEQLDVRYIMDGTVRRAGDRLRITAQMIDPRTESALWSQSFDRTLGDIFAIQDDIAGEVVNKLEIELVGAKLTSRPVDPEAWALFLRAKNLVNKQHWEMTQQGEELLKESLEIDPNNPDGWLLYWTILTQKVYFTEYTAPEFAVEARSYLEKVLDIDPDNVQAKVRLAHLAYEAMSSREGEVRAWAYGMTLDPGDVEFNWGVGTLLRDAGLPRAVDYSLYAAARDPMTASVQRSLMLAQLAAGNIAAALEANRRLREITGGIGGLWFFGMMHILNGDLEAASAAFDEWWVGNGQREDDGIGISGRALIHFLRDENADYERELEKLTRIQGAEELVAILYAWAGREDEAIEILDGLIDPPRSWGSQFMSMPRLFKDLERHPGWENLLRKRGTHPEQVAAWNLDQLFPGPGLPPTIPVEAP